MAFLLIPLPWWEGRKGRGKIDALFTPTLVLPHQGGGELRMPRSEARGALPSPVCGLLCHPSMETTQWAVQKYRVFRVEIQDLTYLSQKTVLLASGTNAPLSRISEEHDYVAWIEEKTTPTPDS
jgi:hypothetical protein